MKSVIYVPDSGVWQRDGSPGGLSLLERQILQLGALDIDAPVLVVPVGDPEPVLPRRCQIGALVRVPKETPSAFAALAAAVAVLPADFVFLAADRLVDPRVLRALAACSGSVVACSADASPEPVARVRAADLRRYGSELAGHVRRLALDSLDPYVTELRGTVVPYILSVRSPAERRAAWPVLLDGVQKRALDLPGRYFDTPFENFLLRRIAPTNLTPNQVTLATIVLACAVGTLFLHGWLRTGVLLALLVGVLDGVDGKLARLKLATSKIGEFEHVADFFYENFWYLAIAAHLQAVTGIAGLWQAGLFLAGFDLTDNLLYLVVRVRTGSVLDELSQFDRSFRLIAGRRNVYVMIFAAGFFGGGPAAAFVAATLWAGVTAVVHALRALGALRKPLSPTEAAAPEVSEIEPAAGVALSEK